MSPQRVVITRRMPPPAATMLAEAGVSVDEFATDWPLPRADALARVGGAVGVITMLSDRVDESFLEAAGAGLKIVANYAVGFDNIDIAACARRGVQVSNTPGVLTDATADLAWTLILAAARHVPAGDRVMRAGDWPGWCPTQLLGLQLSGATLGIVGAGRIGTATALRSVGFNMRVVYVDPRRNEQIETRCGARRVELDELLRESDVVSLHMPMAPENHHLIDSAALALMKPTAILVNTARGPIVDEAALAAALRDGEIAAAGLDVYEDEPRVYAGLADLPNTVLLPHLGSATTATREKMSAMAAENVLAVLNGKEPPNTVR